MTASASSTAASPTADASTTAWYALTPDDALRRQNVDVDKGLTSAEADARRAKVGSNTFTAAKTVSRAQLFIAQYADPMQIVLLIAGVICLFLPGQVFTGLMLLLLTLGNAVMGLNQETKAAAAADALSQKLAVTAKTRRSGDLVDLPMDQLVPGDVVNLQAGDLVPADARILSAATLEIDESALTGESVPNPKAGGRRWCRRRPRGSRGHGVHEHPGHPRIRHDPRRDDGHGHPGRPHQRDAPGHRD